MSKTYDSIDAHTISGFNSEQDATKFIADTLIRWEYAVQSVNGNKIDLGLYDIGVTKTTDDNYELQVYTSSPPRFASTLYDYYDTLVSKLAWQSRYKNQLLDEHCYYEEPESNPQEYEYNNWIPVSTHNFDWFNTAYEYVEFFSKTLNRWYMPTAVENFSVICNKEQFKLTIAPVRLSADCNKNIFEITMHSKGKHILSMLHEIMDCLRVQANSDRELTEDEAFELIDVELANMTEEQVQHYLRNNGCDPRDEINEWAIDYSGVCDNITRISFCRFTDAIINIHIKNSYNINGATFTNSRFASAIVLENVTFAHCVFDNVEFDCKMTNVTFENCVIKNVSWPGKICNIQVLNHGNTTTEEMKFEDL